MSTHLDVMRALSARTFTADEPTLDLSTTKISFQGLTHRTAAQPPAATQPVVGLSAASLWARILGDATPSIAMASPEFIVQERIFDLTAKLYATALRRNRQIADRLTALHRDAVDEEQNIVLKSIDQLVQFFLNHPDLERPKITLTPDGTLSARWIKGKNDFTDIEFTGRPLAKLIAEIPRGEGLTARYFSQEPVRNILGAARALGASFV